MGHKSVRKKSRKVYDDEDYEYPVERFSQKKKKGKHRKNAKESPKDKKV